MDLKEIISKWKLTKEGVEKLSANGTLQPHEIERNALKADLKGISEPSLKSATNDDSPIILQVLRVKNVAVPKADPGSKSGPRLLKLILSDGHTNVQGIEMENIPNVGIDTIPGAKLLIKPQFNNGFLLLNGQNCKYLGGSVHELEEKWKMSQLSSQLKNRRSTGAPPWIAFGKSKPNLVKDQKVPDLKSFKTFTDPAAAKPKTEQNSEFEMLRKETIADAANQTKRKTFGGGVKPANNFNATNNRDNSSSNYSANSPYQDRPPRRYERNENRPPRPERGRNATYGTDDESARPSERLSLLDYFDVGKMGGANAQANEPRSNRSNPRGRYDSSEPSVSKVTERLDKMSFGKKDEEEGWVWHEGDRCMAKYWEDSKFYNAVVTAVADRTCVVHFFDYGNYEEVVKEDCIPITEESVENKHLRPAHGPRKFEGSRNRYRR